MPCLMAFVSDFMFIARIDAVTAHLGIETIYIESESDIGPASSKNHTERPGEALEGREGALVRLLAEKQPGLLIFDLNAGEIPWARWIALVKSGAATRRIPVLAFGSHMDVETMMAAREAGADQVLARSRFTTELPDLIQKHMRRQDDAAVAAACLEPLSELAIQGIELFNRLEFFEAHEVLEAAWNEDESAARELYRAILQVSVAYLQVQRGNYRGAVKMFLRVRQWLGPLPDICRGVDVAGLRAAALAAEAEVLRLGSDRIAAFDAALFKNVDLVR